MGVLNPREQTWAALLGRWVEFAQSAVALPDSAEGKAWREAVPEIIGLQAVSMALNEVGSLTDEERALGLDRARLLVDEHEQKLMALFGRDLIHPQLEELLDDARLSIKRVESMDGEPGEGLDA